MKSFNSILFTIFAISLSPNLISMEQDLIDQTEKNTLSEKDLAQEKSIVLQNKKYFWNITSQTFLLSQAQQTGIFSEKLKENFRAKAFNEFSDLTKLYMQKLATASQEVYLFDYMHRESHYRLPKGRIDLQKLPTVLNVVHLAVCVDDHEFFKRYLSFFNQLNLLINDAAPENYLELCDRNGTPSYTTPKQLNFTTPLKLALDQKYDRFSKEKITTIKLLISCGADVNLEYKTFGFNIPKSQEDYQPLIIRAYDYAYNIKNGAEHALRNILAIFEFYGGVGTDMIQNLTKVATIVLEHIDQNTEKYLREKYLNKQLILRFFNLARRSQTRPEELFTLNNKDKTDEELADLFIYIFTQLINKEEVDLEFLNN